MIVCNDNVTVDVVGNVITTSNGDIYNLAGLVLFKNGSMISMNVSSIDAAVGIVIGAHGGRKL